jgi:hypothetical protein
VDRADTTELEVKDPLPQLRFSLRSTGYCIPAIGSTLPDCPLKSCPTVGEIRFIGIDSPMIRVSLSRFLSRGATSIREEKDGLDSWVGEGAETTGFPVGVSPGEEAKVVGKCKNSDGSFCSILDLEVEASWRFSVMVESCESRPCDCSVAGIAQNPASDFLSISRSAVKVEGAMVESREDVLSVG